MRSLPQHRPVPGRRPSVGPTTARRHPSVRRRPGAGFLPAWRPAARVGAPGARFQVYAEDEYFAQGGQIAEIARDGSGWPIRSSVFSADVAPDDGGRGLRIAVGAVLIAGAGELGVVLALGAFASSTHVRRKTALRAARANARTPRATSVITAQTQTSHLRPKTISGRTQRIRPLPARHARSARSSAPRSRSNARFSKPAASRSATARPLPSPDVAGSQSELPGGPTSSGGSSGHNTEMAAASNTPSRPVSGEFGFER